MDIKFCDCKISTPNQVARFQVEGLETGTDVDGHFFTISELLKGKKSGSKFWICVTDSSSQETIACSLWPEQYYVTGNYQVLAFISGSEKSNRLQKWWKALQTDHDPFAYIAWCMENINKRTLPPMPSGDAEAEPASEPSSFEPYTLLLSLSKIQLDGGTQSRMRTEPIVVDRYARIMQDDLWNWEFNPPIVFFDGETYWPGDGHHRIQAALSCNISEMLVEVRHGSVRDAIFYSLGANAMHGFGRNSEDKRKQVTMILRDPEWCQMSNRAIAAHCRVSPPFVAGLRDKLSNTGQIVSSSTRTTRSGTVMDTTNIGKKPSGSDSSPSPEPASSLPPDVDKSGTVTEDFQLQPSDPPLFSDTEYQSAHSNDTSASECTESLFDEYSEIVDSHFPDVQSLLNFLYYAIDTHFDGVLPTRYSEDAKP